MTTVTVSPRFQVVIPRVIRDAMGIRPGQRIQALQHKDGIQLIPLRPSMRRSRGMLQEGGAQQSTYVPRTELGRRLIELRNKGLRSGMKVLTVSEINAELANRRGESSGC